MSKRSVATSVEDDEFDEDAPLFRGKPVSAILSDGWKTVAGALVVGTALGVGGAFLIPPVFTAKTVILPPQQQGSAAAAMIGSLGALGALAGGLGGIKSPAEQYIGLMSSTTVADQIIDRFKLMEVYDEEFRTDARKKLAKNLSVTAGKKDSLITIEVDDKDPKRAADMANAFVENLRTLTNTLAVTEAQQRRVFFEQKLAETKDRLVKTQVALQSTGFNASALRAEPRATAEGYARLRAEAMAAEIKLGVMRNSLTDRAPELQQQQSIVSSLRSELSRMEQRQQDNSTDADYISRYREYKYQETLFELYARQFEVARVDESREGALIQVLDLAQPPEKKSKPKRAYIGLGAGAVVTLLAGMYLVRRQRRVEAPDAAETT